MRDRERAFGYLTGELTGSERPDAVGKKFTLDGAPLACPGFTTLCHVDPGSDAFAALVEAQEQLKAGPLASAFSFLPASSLHMTLFEGVIDYSRTRERWPAHLSTDVPISHVAKDAAQRLKGIEIAKRVCVRPVNIFAGFSVSMSGAGPADDALLRQTRNTLRGATGIHRPDHDSYQFHITLAYLLRWLDPHAAEQIIELSEEIADMLCVKVPEMVVGPVELCRFDTMHHFETVMCL